MPTLQPAQALATCEQALQQLVDIVLKSKIGDDWISQVLSPEKVEKIRARRDEEIRKRARRGVAASPMGKLSYVQFFEIVEIIKKRWVDFEPALGKRSETIALLDRFDALRNSVAHSRDLLPWEAELLSGIAGEIRNKVTIYVTHQDPVGNYFARIESVTDSFGHRIDNFADPHGNSLDTGLTLHPGQVVTFSCHGTDPQGRDLRWWMLANTGSLRNSQAVAGRDVELAWQVAEEDVSAQTVIIIYMASDGPHHRSGGPFSYDQAALFRYTVLPPSGP